MRGEKKICLCNHFEHDMPRVYTFILRGVKRFGSVVWCLSILENSQHLFLKYFFAHVILFGLLCSSNPQEYPLGPGWVVQLERHPLHQKAAGLIPSWVL